MSTVKTNNVQIGQSVTATNNFTWYQPSTPDGTVRLGNGNSGSVTDLVTLTSAGNLGIGTSSPGYRLEVAYGSTSDALVITGSVDNITPYLSFKASNGGSSYIRGRVRGTAPDSTNGGLAFDTGASGSMSEKMRLDSSGNLGLGVTPSAWSAGKAIEIGNAGDGLSINYGAGLNLNRNAYYNGGFKYGSTDYASRYAQASGQHQWFTAPSGTAGNAISFTQAMTLDASGNLLVGTTSAVGKITVAGDVAQSTISSAAALTSYNQIYYSNTSLGNDNTAIDIATGVYIYYTAVIEIVVCNGDTLETAATVWVDSRETTVQSTILGGFNTTNIAVVNGKTGTSAKFNICCNSQTGGNSYLAIRNRMGGTRRVYMTTRVISQR